MSGLATTPLSVSPSGPDTAAQRQAAAQPSSARALRRAVSVADMRRLAQHRLPRALFDFIDGGAGDEITLRDNAAAFEQWSILPRQMEDVARRDLSVSLLGRQTGLPLMLSPTGLAGMFWPHGELAAVRATAAADMPLCLSTNSVASMEEVAAAAPGADLWFQLYFLKDRAWMEALLSRARTAGYRVLCMTLDLPVHGLRERDERNAFTIPLRPRLSNILDLARRPSWIAGAMRAPPRFGNFETPEIKGLASIARRARNLFDPTTTWDDVARIRAAWPGPFVVKGVLHPADAERAVRLGADGIMVSNHGGRQLDRVPSAIDALPEIVAAVGSRADVILDGGVRRGTDIFTALALGARACSIGRSYLWGLSAGGEAGVAKVIAMLRAELDNALALTGCADIAAVNRGHVRHRNEPAGRWPVVAA